MALKRPKSQKKSMRKLVDQKRQTQIKGEQPLALLIFQSESSLSLISLTNMKKNVRKK